VLQAAAAEPITTVLENVKFAINLAQIALEQVIHNVLHAKVDIIITITLHQVFLIA